MPGTYLPAAAARADSPGRGRFLKEADARERFLHSSFATMNAPKKLILVVALLLAAGRLAAHLAQGPAPHIPNHEHPEFVAVTTTATFDDGTTVSWSPMPNARGSYYVTITQVPGAKEKIYSLLTLGLQGIRLPYTVTRVGTLGGTVLHYQHGDPTGTPWPAGRRIDPTGLNAANDHLDPDKIEFLSFSGTSCQFLVTITLGKAMGETKWSGMPSGKSGHDNTPPDGYPPQ